MLSEALKSVFSQTFRDFSILVVDDCSKPAEVKGLDSPSVRVLKNKKHEGIVFGLNRIISNTDSQYVARLDTDDLMVPNRLTRQVNFLDRHPRVAVVGSAIRYFGASSGFYRPPRSHRSIMIRMLFENCLAHPSVLMRRSALEDLEGPYRSDFEYAEDWDLWERLSEEWELANLRDVLTYVRVHSNQMSRDTSQAKRERLENVRHRFAERQGVTLAALKPGLFPLFVRTVRHSFSVSPNRLRFRDIFSAYAMNMTLSNNIRKARAKLVSR